MGNMMTIPWSCYESRRPCVKKHNRHAVITAWSWHGTHVFFRPKWKLMALPYTFFECYSMICMSGKYRKKTRNHVQGWIYSLKVQVFTQKAKLKLMTRVHQCRHETVFEVRNCLSHEAFTYVSLSILRMIRRQTSVFKNEHQWNLRVTTNVLFGHFFYFWTVVFSVTCPLVSMHFSGAEFEEILAFSSV